MFRVEVVVEPVFNRGSNGQFGVREELERRFRQDVGGGVSQTTAILVKLAISTVEPILTHFQLQTVFITSLSTFYKVGTLKKFPKEAKGCWRFCENMSGLNAPLECVHEDVSVVIFQKLGLWREFPRLANFCAVKFGDEPYFF